MSSGPLTTTPVAPPERTANTCRRTTRREKSGSQKDSNRTFHLPANMKTEPPLNPNTSTGFIQQETRHSCIYSCTTNRVQVSFQSIFVENSLNKSVFAFHCFSSFLYFFSDLFCSLTTNDFTVMITDCWESECSRTRVFPQNKQRLAFITFLKNN